MTIQKKSLISSLNTTKKAIVASSPLEAPTASDKAVKLAKPARLARAAKLAKVQNMARFAKFTNFAKLGKV